MLGSALKPLLTLAVIGLAGMVLVVRDVEWGPFYVMWVLSGYEVRIKFGVKFWSDGVVSLVISDCELPLREFPKWLRTAMYRFEGLWHRGYGDGCTLYFLYFDESSIMNLPGLAPGVVKRFVKDAIEDIRRRALRG